VLRRAAAAAAGRAAEKKKRPPRVVVVQEPMAKVAFSALGPSDRETLVVALRDYSRHSLIEATKVAPF